MTILPLLKDVHLNLGQLVLLVLSLQHILCQVPTCVKINIITSIHPTPISTHTPSHHIVEATVGVASPSLHKISLELEHLHIGSLVILPVL